MTKVATKRQLDLIETGCSIIENDQSNVVGYGMRALAMACMPYTRPSAGDPHLVNGCWVRENGNYRLWMQGGPAGLPYGAYPRLFVIHAASMAVRTRSRHISLGTFGDFCREIGIDRSMGCRGQGYAMTVQMQRVLQARFGFERGIDVGTGRIDQAKRIEFASEENLWWSNRGEGRLQKGEIVLGEKMFKEMIERPVPLNLDAVKKLKTAPMDLDLYTWLAARMHTVKRRTHVPWPDLVMQFGARYKDLREFRRNFGASLRRVQLVYDGLRAFPSTKALVLDPSPTPVRRIQVAVEKPVEKPSYSE